MCMVSILNMLTRKFGMWSPFDGKNIITLPWVWFGLRCTYTVIFTAKNQFKLKFGMQFLFDQKRKYHLSQEEIVMQTARLVQQSNQVEKDLIDYTKHKQPHSHIITYSGYMDATCYCIGPLE